jgi:hypothetical protein
MDTFEDPFGPESPAPTTRARRISRQSLPYPHHQPAEPYRDPYSGLLRVDRQPSGTTVTGPGVYVWDSNHELALEWARQLTRTLHRRAGR